VSHTNAGSTSSPGREDRPGIILLARLDKGPPTEAFAGLANLELGVPIEEDTTFNVGSIAKQITAHLLVRASRDGLLALDRTVGAILPRFRVPSVSVGDLIQHHGGIRDTESLLPLAGFRNLDHYTAADLLELAYRQDRRAVRRGRFLYSNTGYLVLVEILQHIYSTELQEIAHRKIFAPLGMTSARFKTDPREVIRGAASSYQYTTDGYLHQQGPVAIPGPGSLWCSAPDLDRWLSHLSREWSITPDGQFPFEQQIKYRVSDHHPFTYGAGLYADAQSLRPMVFHYGHEQGFSAAVHLWRSGRRVICLSNHAGISAEGVLAAASSSLDRRPGGDLRSLLTRTLSIGERPTHSAVTYTAYHGESETDHAPLGTFTCREVPGSLRLTYSKGILYLWRRGVQDRLTPTGPTTYSGDGYTLTVRDVDPINPQSGFVINLKRAPDLHYRLK
jgi:CubicO group peptidase (beta-lactamase class C family)